MNAAVPDIASLVRAQFHAAPPAKLGIAVSGGGDSMAMMHILANCFDSGEVEIFVATVDHGLRRESRAEAKEVAVQAELLGLPHDILTWQRTDTRGNLQDQARRARYRLLSDWAKSKSIAIIALGHTADDQAETVLMRLARSAGVTGLAAMPVRRTMYGITMFRPLLDVSRLDLRHYLQSNGISWVDDPSNDDLTYDRIKARRALQELEPLGFSVSTLANVAKNMSQAREALDWYGFLAARDMVTIIGGDVVISLNKFRALPDEIARRLLQRTLMWISGGEYSPRRASMIEALKAARHGHSITLNGCRLLCDDRRVWVCREHNAVRNTVSSCDQLWDGRWRLYGGNAVGCDLRVLGKDGLRLCPNWRETGTPRPALAATPAVWRGDDLVAAPLAGFANNWTAELAGGEEDFYASLLSH